MKICFSYYFPKYKPKGDVLQFLILLKAFEKKLADLYLIQNRQFQIDCVLPFEFQNGKDGFLFQHVRFIQSKQLAKTIAELDKNIDYDYIFIRCRENSQDALELIKEHQQIASKLLVLILHYKLDDPNNMKDIIHIFKNSRMIFLQTQPWTERLKSYLLQQGFSQIEINKKLKILPQFIESYQMADPLPQRFNPPHLVQTGVIRLRYGLPVAIEGMKLIRKIYPQVYLHLAYPSIADDISDQAASLINAPEIKNYGMLSMWETKKMILQSGIGLALIYDNTENQNPSYSYLSRILEYASLGVPFITTKTIGNKHLLGEKYPLFVQDEHDIFECYQKLTNPDYYQEMSDFVRRIGHKFSSEVAIEEFWMILERNLKKPK
ncbi:glycosyltransferase family 1 protein [Neobacillus bataviensis]|uniref:glycosyltransferase family 1 protein n=1 Tax=Neobacillus bataviensis TaxID=220685 RepID=UPI001CC0B549|nr:glycosyltransferase family 1 protein [Neobacillus bataviensis]